MLRHERPGIDDMASRIVFNEGYGLGARAGRAGVGVVGDDWDGLKDRECRRRFEG